MKRAAPVSAEDSARHASVPGHPPSNLPHPLRASLGRAVSLLLLGVLASALVASVGCKSSSGSREFIPGKGWVPTD